MISTKDKFKFVVSARDDFVRDNDEYDRLLFNPEWKVSPSIAIVNGKGPCSLTCHDHDHGSKHHNNIIYLGIISFLTNSSEKNIFHRISRCSQRLSSPRKVLLSRDTLTILLDLESEPNVISSERIGMDEGKDFWLCSIEQKGSFRQNILVCGAQRTGSNKDIEGKIGIKELAQFTL